MTTKEIFLSLGISAGYVDMVNKIDYNKLDRFVAMFIGSYVNKRGADAIREELSVDAISDTTNFLTRLIEVGTVQFLSENGLLSANEEETKDLASIVAHGINISMAAELQLNGLDPMGSNIFFDIRSLYELIERAISHIANAREDNGYIFSLVSFNLLNFVNRSTIE